MTRGEGTFAQLQLERYTAHAALNAESGWRAADESTPTRSSSISGCRWSTACCAACARAAPDTPVPDATTLSTIVWPTQRGNRTRQSGSSPSGSTTSFALPATAQGVLLTDASRFLRACRRQPVDLTPVWFMRQAGRYMAEYRALREQYSLLEICRTPDLATEVTMQPVRRIELDAAILFSDLLLPLEPMGIGFDFIRGEGPAIEKPLRRDDDLARVRRFDPRESLGYVLQAIRQIKRELAGRVPLIGFAGAPFTLASYAIEGGHSTAFAHTKALMYGSPAAWHRFCALVADLISEYLLAQVEAGVDVVQVFDSWVGVLNARDYREFILPHSKRIFDALAPTGVPTIHFGVGTGSILADLRDAGGHVIGADWRTPLDEAWMRIGYDHGIQGNLDPTLLLGPLERVFAATDDILGRAGGRPGHIFNLGHGILPSTPLEHVQALARYVHQKTRH